MNIESEISRLNFEDFLQVLFIGLAILNIIGDYDDKMFLISNHSFYKQQSDYIFTITIVLAFFIYLYFFIRNYKKYCSIEESKKELYFIKLLGSSFFIAGVICLFYFQIHQSNFLGSSII